MSSASVPEPLKGITSYLQRAEELATRDAVMAYYCNYMAAKSAIEANATDSESQLFMLSLLDKLEADKATMGHNEALSNDVVGYAHVENFALGIFTRADNEDRAGKASKKTAKSFLAASTFLEVLKVFGPVDDGVAEKIKYSRFKAIDIIKAIKEGKQPTPGPPEGDTGVIQDEGGTSGPNDAGPYSVSGVSALPVAPSVSSIPSAPTQLSANETPGPPPPLPTFDLFPSISSGVVPMVAPPPTSVAGPPPHQPAPPHPSPAHPSPTIPTYTPAYNPAPSAPPSHTAYHPPAPSRSSYVPPTGPIDHVIITNATKNCKFAISALQYDDVNTAIDNLEKALALLRPYQK